MTSTYSYDVFGELRPVSAPAYEWLFTGEQRDRQGSRNVYYLRARYHNPANGRFLSHDPLPTGNLYAYVGNNPTDLVDPRGTWPRCPGWVCDRRGDAGECVWNRLDCVREVVCSKEGCLNALRAALGDATDAVLKSS